MNKQHKQQGFTLIELMISIVIGLLISAAVTSMFVSMLYTSKTQLEAVRLNQELRSAMTAIARDIRRSGHNRSAANIIGAANPFALFVRSNSDQTIHFSYDEANDGTIETFGYQRDTANGTIQGCKGTDTACTNWENLTDVNLTNITALTFTENTTVVGGLNLTKITISMTGNLRQDTAFSRTLQQTIEVRN